MPDRPLKLRDLRRILKRYGVHEDTSRGKGSHTLFYKEMDGGCFSYPVPTTSKDVKRCYVAGCRRRFNLTPDFNISDDEFYNS